MPDGIPRARNVGGDQAAQGTTIKDEKDKADAAHEKQLEILALQNQVNAQTAEVNGKSQLQKTLHESTMAMIRNLS